MKIFLIKNHLRMCDYVSSMGVPKFIQIEQDLRNLWRIMQRVSIWTFGEFLTLIAN